jgi:hypothetical protein
MKARLTSKIDAIRSNPAGREFILADARDADMVSGVPSFGTRWPLASAGQSQHRTLPEFLEQIRAVVQQGLVDILLASISTMDRLAHKERLFDATDVTPAIRANDTSDIWGVRGGSYLESPSRPFAGGFLHEAMYGSLTAEPAANPVIDLGLYSVTFNNDLDADQQQLESFKTFRAEAERKRFHYFLEVFAPNVEVRLSPEMIPAYINDQVARMLAPVPASGRPLFLKIPYFGPKWMEELCAYDPSVIVGIMGGASSTTYDSFCMLADAQQHGARAALYGRRIKNAEDPLAFIAAMRHIVDGQMSPTEAVRWYHAELERQAIPTKRCLADDMQSQPNWG